MALSFVIIDDLTVNGKTAWPVFHWQAHEFPDDTEQWEET